MKRGKIKSQNQGQSQSQYFKGLNYSLANEDSSLELALIPKTGLNLISVCGSGSRCLPLLASFPQHLTCVDLSKEQLFLAELRLESIRVLEYSDYLFFWDYPCEVYYNSNVTDNSHSGQKRKELFNKLNLNLETKKYFNYLFVSIQWESLLYQGQWEKTFQKLYRINSCITGRAARSLFDCRSLEEQRFYLESQFPWIRWKLVLFFLSSAKIFNLLLYKGQFPKVNLSKGSFLKFYDSAFKQLFYTGLARENFFLQICFFGKVVFHEGLPLEAQVSTFASMKKALSLTKLEFIQGDIVEVLSNSKIKYDFVSFSDVPSYFSGRKEQTFLQEVKAKLNLGARIVLRFYRYRPEGMLCEDFNDLTEKFDEIISKEKVGVYKIQVLQYVLPYLRPASKLTTPKSP